MIINVTEPHIELTVNEDGDEIQININEGGVLPVGGTTGQVLAKQSDSDYDAEWVDTQTSTEWGQITGDLEDQTDLQSALDAKVDENSPITGATKTKITYDSKGLVTAGADAGISDITGLQTALDAKVPYTGATQDVNLGEFGLLTGNIEFDTTPTNTPTGAGSMYYDDTSGTVVNILKGGNVISKIGETQHVRVYNNTGSNIAKGKVVAINGAQGQRPTIILADADSESLSKDTIGFTAEAINDGAEGFVMIAGVLTNVSTSGMSDGDTLYLSTTAGNYTNVKPEAPVHMVILGFVVNGGSGGAGQIYVKVDNGYELEELHNLKETPKTTAVDADALLLKDSADNNLWKPFSWLNAKSGIKAHMDTFKGVAGGYASLDGSGKIPSSELPSYVDDVVEAASFAALPVTGETGKIYVTIDNNKCYRWSGSVYIQVAQGIDTLTTTGTSGAATLVGSTLNIPQYQGVLTNPVTGTGTAGQVAYWSGTSAVTGSANLFWDNANNQLNIGGTNVFNHRLYVNGILRVADGNAVTNGAGILGGEGLFLSSVSGLNLFASSIYALRIFNATRNIAIQNGGTFTDNGQRLQVYGSTLLRGSGTTSSTTALLVQNSTPTELFKVTDNGAWNFNGDGIVKGSGNTSATTAFAVQNSDGTNILRVRNDQRIMIGNAANPPFIGNGVIFGTGVSAQSLVFYNFVGNLSNDVGAIIFRGDAFIHTTGNPISINANQQFSPTSGTATFASTAITSTINQTGGANGITRGLYVNPTLTAAADWRGIESVAASNANHTLLKLRNATVDVFTVKSDSKIGFWNATPVAQPTTGIAEAAFVENSGGTAVNVDSTFAGYTIQQIAQALKDIGLLA